ncbi:MAG: VOC family protein [Candidatus Obscuribacterales bacterium]|nr:VOC family protein [Candidatus Obscuribacterales bacterium]
MLLKRIHHVAIICSDYQRSKSFYTEILGLSVIAENYRPERKSYKLDLRIGEGDKSDQIELFSFPDPPARVSRPEAAGLRHLAFAVADVAAFIEHLQKHQIPCEPIRIDEFTGRKFTFFQDPDALPLEVYEG